MTITALPTAPSRSDAAATFVSRANAFVAALGQMVTEINLAVADVNADTTAAELSRLAAVAAQAAAELASMAAVSASTYVATSATSLSIATGSTGSFALGEAGRSFAVNDQVTLIRRGAQAVRLRGLVTAFDAVAKTMTVNVTTAPSSGGTATDWLVILSALEGTAPQDVAGLAIAFASVL